MRWNFGQIFQFQQSHGGDRDVELLHRGAGGRGESFDAAFAAIQTRSGSHHGLPTRLFNFDGLASGTMCKSAPL
jgi:hypothetical protein